MPLLLTLFLIYLFSADSTDDMRATVKVDQYSFPSGHCTRVFMLAALAPLVLPDSSGPIPDRALIWAVAVGVSRVVMGRHHILDVLAGAVVGTAQGVILDATLLDPAYCAEIRNGKALGWQQQNLI